MPWRQGGAAKATLERSGSPSRDNAADAVRELRSAAHPAPDGARVPWRQGGAAKATLERSGSPSRDNAADAVRELRQRPIRRSRWA
ncbi:hypothetical protein GCM10009798_34770 [Nocardioides panacihumi]|uniref:Uncharacterized protein n=1 Tax=Nocardioides panacihumi TaxID=400774 RepID=A0ABN2RL83_9ACTN